VAATWMGARDRERARAEEQYFADLWAQRLPTVVVRPFPTVARREFESHAVSNFDEELEQLLSPADRPRDDPRGRLAEGTPIVGSGLVACERSTWILAFATGSGKTFTAITAIREAIREAERGRGRRGARQGDLSSMVRRNWSKRRVTSECDPRAGRRPHAFGGRVFDCGLAPGEQPRIVLVTRTHGFEATGFGSS